jgi:pimeloyl-ACP methyl ester carboxylesterase
MPVVKLADAAIYYEEYGRGYPVLLFAPGGMRSRIDRWHGPASSPVDDWTVTLAASYRVIAMDQRNAGQSHAPIRADDGWHSYAADQLSLMDYLGFTRFHILGACIGGSFCLRLCDDASERISASVLQNPVGFNPEFPQYLHEEFEDWAKEQGDTHRDLDPAAIAAFHQNMWGGEFVFSVTRKSVQQCTVPSLLLPGSDKPHPAIASAEIATLLPRVEVLHNWRAPDYLHAQQHSVLAFLARHTP